MTHTASHIIISAFRAPLTAAGGLKVWHFTLAIFALGFLLGAWLF